MSSRKRVHEESQGGETKRRRRGESSSYLGYFWKKLCNFLGVGESSRVEEEEETGDSSSEDEGPIILSSCSSSRGILLLGEEANVMEEVETKKKDSFSSLGSRQRGFLVSTREKKAKEKSCNSPSSILEAVRSPSPHKRENSVYQNIFHPKLGHTRRSSFLKHGNRVKRFPHHSGMAASVRLDERAKYLKLISEYGTVSVKNLVNNDRSLSSQKRVSVVDLADEDDVPVVLAESTPAPRGLSYSKDADIVEILDRYVKKDTSTPIDSSSVALNKNSLDVELSKSPLFSDDFLPSLLEKYSSRSRDRERKIRDETVKKEYCNERNRESIKSIEESIKRHLSITNVVLEVEEPEEKDELPEIDDKILGVIKKAQHSNGRVLVDQYNIAITRKDVDTLKGLNWLNDEIINFYLQMIVNRSSSSEKKWPKVYAFNTFFYSKLISGGHVSLKRWTRKVDIFSYDLILIPVHLGVHWCLATVDFRTPGVFYYDSMGGNNKACLEALIKYLEDEHKDKKKTSYNTSNFKSVIVKNMPQQMNGSDCGMFTCKTAEYLSRDAKLTFTQENMPYFRQRMVYEIVKNNILYP